MIIENKFLIGSIISGAIALFLIIFYVYSIFSPTIIPHTFYPQDILQTGEGQGRIFDYAFNKTAILIENGQYFWWAKAWNANAKLKRMELDYYAPNGTQIRVDSIYYTIGKYWLNGKSTLAIENLSLTYQNNVNYGMRIINDGESPVYLFSVKTEEEQIPILQNVPFLLIGYIFIFPFAYFYKKHKNRTITITPLDKLYKEARLADRIKNVKLELKNYQSSLRYLEELNFRKELSPDFYLKKKEYFEEVIDKLTKEKNNVDSEINDILNSRNE